MLDVVVDTNVLVRAFLKPDSSDGEIIRRVVDRKLNLYISQEQFNELVRVLQYPRLQKYDVNDATVATFLKTIVSFGKFVIPQKTDLCRDKPDNAILGTALALIGKNQVFLITADKDLLVLKGKVDGIDILTPQEFLKSVRLSGR